MKFITHLQQKLEAYLPEIIASYEGEIEAASLSEMEITIRQMSHEVGGKVLRTCLEAQTPKYPEDEVK